MSLVIVHFSLPSCTLQIQSEIPTEWMRSYEPSQLRGKILDLIDQSLEEYEAHVHCDNPEYQTVVLENPL
jgi:hypothetical protein